MAFELTGAPLVAAVAGAAFLPALAFAFWVRHTERFHREPARELLRAFAWGGTGGIALAIGLELLLGGRPDTLAGLGVSSIVFLAVLVAPFVEEFAKAVGLRWVRDDHPEPEDGLIYGAAAGFGFAATENLAYATASYVGGGVHEVATTLLARTVSSTFLHGAATALVGYALWQRRAGARDASVARAYLLAVGLHALFNLGASIALAITGLASTVLALGGFAWVRRRLRGLDHDDNPVRGPGS